MSARVLVAGIGNPSFRDDGFGVVLAAALSRANNGGLTVVGPGMALAYKLTEAPWDLLVVLDAASRGGPAGTLYVLEPDVDNDRVGACEATHAAELDTLLATAKEMGARIPRVLVVACEPDDVRVGRGLSAAVSQAISEAGEFVRRLVDFETPIEARI